MESKTEEDDPPATNVPTESRRSAAKAEGAERIPSTRLDPTSGPAEETSPTRKDPPPPETQTVNGGGQRVIEPRLGGSRPRTRLAKRREEAAAAALAAEVDMGADPGEPGLEIRAAPITTSQAHVERQNGGSAPMDMETKAKGESSSKRDQATALRPNLRRRQPTTVGKQMTWADTGAGEEAGAAAQATRPTPRTTKRMATEGSKGAARRRADPAKSTDKVGVVGEGRQADVAAPAQTSEQRRPRAEPNTRTKPVTSVRNGSGPYR
jgi:hypothetical protein